MFLSNPVPIDDTFIERPPVEVFQSLLNKQKFSSMDKATVSKKNTLRIIELKSEALRISTLHSFYSNFNELKNGLISKSSNLDTIFNFTPLMLSGGSILPPVISENNNRINKNKNTLILTKRSFDITSPARLISTVPTWRDYVISTKHVLPPTPSEDILPSNELEKLAWQASIKAGWNLGKNQAEDELVQSIRRLTTDYLGMLRFTLLLKKNMISAPYVSVTNLGITNTDTNLNIGQSSIKLIQPSFFNDNYKGWQFIPSFTDKL
jgi:defect-in-organelle-trafficking protein DotC